MPTTDSCHSVPATDSCVPVQRFEIPIEHEAAPVTSQPEAPVPEEPAAAGPAEPGQAQRYDKATGEEDGSWVEVPDEGI